MIYIRVHLTHTNSTTTTERHLTLLGEVLEEVVKLMSYRRRVRNSSKRQIAAPCLGREHPVSQLLNYSVPLKHTDTQTHTHYACTGSGGRGSCTTANLMLTEGIVFGLQALPIVWLFSTKRHIHLTAFNTVLRA